MFLTVSKGNPIYCNCYMQSLRQWARVGAVKLLGACSGPPHLSDEPLQAVAPLDLRCRSSGESPMVEEEEGRVPPTVTAKPKQKTKCPANCQCDVSWRRKTLLGHFYTFPQFTSSISCSLDNRSRKKSIFRRFAVFATHSLCSQHCLLPF